MSIVRWEPFRDLSSIQSEMNRLFSTVLESPGTAAGQSAGVQRRWAPAMDLLESGDHFVLRADLPGLSEEDVSIEVEDSTLTVSGERRFEQQVDEGGFHRVERAYGTFSRSLTLPPGVDPEGVSAEFDRGVLEVRIPKPEDSRPRKITIGTNRQETIEQ